MIFDLPHLTDPVQSFDPAHVLKAVRTNRDQLLDVIDRKDEEIAFVKAYADDRDRLIVHLQSVIDSMQAIIVKLQDEVGALKVRPAGSDAWEREAVSMREVNRLNLRLISELEARIEVLRTDQDAACETIRRLRADLDEAREATRKLRDELWLRNELGKERS